MMRTTPSTGERLDHAIDLLVAGSRSAPAAATAGLGIGDRELVATADRLRRSLPIPPPSPRFEAALGARLAGVASSRGAGVAWALRHPGRLIVGGAVGSAVGVGVTAYAVWRTSRRSAGARLLHR
jgi:hypothetical protein